MKKRILAILLALTMLFALLAGCGKDNAETDNEEKETPSLAKGCYMLLDEEEETVGYLNSTGKKLTAYDAAGACLMEQAKFSWDEEEEAFVIDGTAAFTLEIAKKTTTLTVPKKSPLGFAKGSYTLEACEETDIPTGTEPAPSAAAEPKPVMLPEGSYAVCDRNAYDELSCHGYAVVVGTEMYLYEDDIEEAYLGTVTVSYDPETGITALKTDDDTEEYYFYDYVGAQGKGYQGVSLKDPNEEIILLEYDYHPVLPPEMPAATEAQPVALPDGSYAVYNDEELDGYLVLSDGSASGYDTDGIQTGTVTWSYDASTGITTLTENGNATEYYVYPAEEANTYRVVPLKEPSIVTVLALSDFAHTDTEQSPVPEANTETVILSYNGHTLTGRFTSDWVDNWSYGVYGDSWSYIWCEPTVAGDYCQIFADLSIIDAEEVTAAELDEYVNVLRQEYHNYLETDVYTNTWNGVEWHYSYTTDVSDGVIAGQLTIAAAQNGCLVLGNLNFVTMSQSAYSPAYEIFNTFVGTWKIN